MMALRATFSAVMGMAPTGTMPTMSSGFRLTEPRNSARRSGVGGTTGRPSVRPWLKVILDGFKIVESLMGVGCQAVLPPHMHGRAEEIITLGGLGQRQEKLWKG